MLLTDLCLPAVDHAAVGRAVWRDAPAIGGQSQQRQPGGGAAVCAVEGDQRHSFGCARHRVSACFGAPARPLAPTDRLLLDLAVGAAASTALAVVADHGLAGGRRVAVGHCVAVLALVAHQADVVAVGARSVNVAERRGQRCQPARLGQRPGWRSGARRGGAAGAVPASDAQGRAARRGKDVCKRNCASAAFVSVGTHSATGKGRREGSLTQNCNSLLVR